MMSRIGPLGLRLLAAALFGGVSVTPLGAASGLQPDRKETRTEAVQSLAGEWRFALDPKDLGEKERWPERDLPDKIRLPGSTTENGFGDEVSLDTKWTGTVRLKEWFKDPRYAKYITPRSIKFPFWLQPLKHYVGAAWYQREISIPETWRNKRIVLVLERCHWETRVWVDGKEIGMGNSLSAPHEYDLSDATTPGKHRLTVRVDNRYKIAVGVDAHSVSDHTQTNWNGVVGAIELWATDRVWIEDVQVYPDVRNKRAKVRLMIGNATGKAIEGIITLQAESFNGERRHAPASATMDFAAPKPQTAIDVDYPMGDDVLLWDEFRPNLYRLTVDLKSSNGEFVGSKQVTFGMREIGTEGTQFTINGRKTFLRGTLECCIFPLTGYPPTDGDSWIRILKVAKAHGLNHLRFHSWCPPEAAFAAADRMGFLYHVECAAWAAVGSNPETDAFLRAEADRILKAYGNHPSFCLMAYGNEPGGPRESRDRFLTGLLRDWKAKDSRRLYTSAAGWPILPENQFHSTPEPRGQQWGAQLGGRFNARPPETVTDYRDFVARHDVPVVSHEIGQWCVYPNFKEIAKYTGVLRARNFEIFRDHLKEKHMLDQADDFLMASGKLQALLYKEEIESALRTPGMGGFQLLDLHDFPGQGTALVGVLDAFWDSKGYISPEEHHRFACETVPLARMKKRAWTADETFSAALEVAHFGPAPLRRASVGWSIRYADGRDVATGDLPVRDIEIGNGIGIGQVELPLRGIEAPAKMNLIVTIKGTPYRNDWDFWVYPQTVDAVAPKGIRVVDRLGDEAMVALDGGGKVMLLPARNTVSGDQLGKVPAGFTSIFWNTAWTQRQAPHTLGILCNPKHPALAQFPTEFHSNWQWWDLATRSQIMILDEFAGDFRPIVQVIDDWFTNRRLGLVFEAKVGKGKLLVCAIDLESDLPNRPVARQMLHSLLRYMESPAFAPETEIPVTALRRLFREPTALSRAY